MIIEKTVKTANDLGLILIADKLMSDGRDYHDMLNDLIVIVRDCGQVWLCKLGEENNLDTAELIERIM